MPGYLITVDGVHVRIPLDPALHANWQNQFQQKQGKVADLRKQTLKQMIREAYRQGLRDGRATVASQTRAR